MEYFLDGVEANDDWNLKWHHKVWDTCKAREIWDLILDNMVIMMIQPPVFCFLHQPVLLSFQLFMI